MLDFLIAMVFTFVLTFELRDFIGLLKLFLCDLEDVKNVPKSGYFKGRLFWSREKLGFSALRVLIAMVAFFALIG